MISRGSTSLKRNYFAKQRTHLLIIILAVSQRDLLPLLILHNVASLYCLHLVYLVYNPLKVDTLLVRVLGNAAVTDG